MLLIFLRSVTEFRFGISDKAIIKLANKDNMVIITFDKDFGKLIFKLRMKSKGIILLQFHPQTIDYIVSILRNVFRLQIDFIKSFVVVETGRIRAIPLTKINFFSSLHISLNPYNVWEPKNNSLLGYGVIGVG